MRLDRRATHQPSALLFVTCLVAIAALGQAPSVDQNPGILNVTPTVVYRTDPGTGVAIFRVFAEKPSIPLDRQALLKMVSFSDQTTTWQTTEDTAVGAFTNIPFGDYDVEVSAVGYLSMHKLVHAASSQLQQFDVILHRDPAAAILDFNDGALPAKARKHMKAAVSALKSRRFQDAQKHLNEAYKLAPSSAQLNFLLGYSYFQQKDYEKASSFLEIATEVTPDDGQSLTLLGRSYLELKQFGLAQSVLEKAVAINAESWLAHNLLADACFHQKNYSRARDEAQVAIDKGRTEANPARLVLGQSLINLGLNEQGIQTLNTFLQQSPAQPMAGQVRSLIAEIRDHTLTTRSAADEKQSSSKLAGVDPLQGLDSPGLSVKSWQPPGIDDVRVPIAVGVACPSERIALETGQHVVELATDLARFSAIEDLFHQDVDIFGNPIRTETRKYNYVASISEPEPGYLAVDEYRTDKIELQSYPDKIASTGFAALALVFHPDMRDNFEMKCEGLGDWHGQANWVVYFKQRDDKPNRMQSYKVGQTIYPIKMRGRAWITADKFQIRRIEAEMVRPMPEIKLLSEHQVVDYGPVRFDKKNTSIWLPKSAEIYFDFRQHRYYRRHSFDHYMLFSVDSDEKSKPPVATISRQGVTPAQP